MKKLFFSILLALFVVTANAQITKPQAGNLFFELKATGISSLQADLNQTYGGFLFRKFTSEKFAHRFSGDFGMVIGDETMLNFAEFGWGLEYHLKGSERISTYWGHDLGVRGENDFDNILLRAGLFTGFDFFLVDGLYTGAEVGFRLILGLDPVQIEFPGTSLNAGLKLGYRF
jgi:hypothetical protein